MKRFTHAVWFLVLSPVLSFAQDAQVSPQLQHATAHKQDSYVLILGDEVVNRGQPADRTTAIAFKKTQKINDYVWYSTPAGCFVFADADELAKMKDGELRWKELNKKWPRNLSQEEKDARYAEMGRLISQRDETIWRVYDERQPQGKMNSMKVECPVSQ